MIILVQSDVSTMVELSPITLVNRCDNKKEGSSFGVLRKVGMTVGDDEHHKSACQFENETSKHD